MPRFGTEDFLLLLLEQLNGKIESETRVQKLAFLGIKEKRLPKFTSFGWEKFGPLSTELWHTSQKMQRQGLLEIRTEKKLTSMGDSYRIKVFELTKKGCIQASQLKKTFTEEDQAIQELCGEYVKIPLDRLLGYVHTAYSERDL